MRLFASKLNTFELLKQENISQPDTEKLVDYQSLEKFLHLHQQLVIKPEWGCGGDLVFFMPLVESNEIAVKWVVKNNGCCDEQSFSGSLAEFYQKLDSGFFEQQENPESHDHQNSEKTSWIIQQFLDLKNGRDKPADIRVIEQRGADGILRPILTHGRVSIYKDTPITNLSKSCNFSSVETVLKGTDLTPQDLFAFCGQVDDCVESQLGYKIGEVGHDLAVVKTSSGWQIFYIEGNSMPGYLLDSWQEITTQEPSPNLLSDRDKDLLINPVEYMKFLLSQELISSS